MSKFLYFSVIRISSSDIFLRVQMLSNKNKKWSFRWLRTCENCQFLLTSRFRIFCLQMSKFLYLSVFLMSSNDDFLLFQKLSKKWRKKYRKPHLWKKTIFISYSWIFCYRISDFLHVSVILMSSNIVFLHFLKVFPKYNKNRSFQWQPTSEKWQFLLVSHFCIFCLQMSDFLHFVCPDVKKWFA